MRVLDIDTLKTSTLKISRFFKLWKLSHFLNFQTNFDVQQMFLSLRLSLIHDFTKSNTKFSDFLLRWSRLHSNWWLYSWLDHEITTKFHQISNKNQLLIQTVANQFKELLFMKMNCKRYLARIELNLTLNETQ